MLELLSDVLRQVLRSSATQQIALAEELEFVERYLAIEQVRFQDRLRTKIEIDPQVSAAIVPSFLLQPLVENALRHGISRRSEAGLLEVKAWRDGPRVVLTVRDDGPGLPAGFEGAGGVGLSNTRARLEALYGSRASLEIANAPDRGAISTVRLPYSEAGAHE